MKLRYFEYLILLHPATDKDGKDIGKTTILQAPKQELAKDEAQVGTLAARAIPAEHLENLDRVEIIVRPF
jgi:putative ubiquitin-RnfH superfamily antitoxin RatB of RatAB toxin-antitoxin module